MATQYTQVVKYNKKFHSKAFQNVPKLEVWFEKKPSGNPGCQDEGLLFDNNLNLVRRVIE
jgi:hypothetical protein